MRIVHWFRRDLRLTDNTALKAAVRDSGGDVVPLFVLDDDLLKGKHVAPARVQFMLDCLRELDASLREWGSQLIVRRGTPEQEVVKLAQEAGADAVYFNRDYTPAARARDQRVTEALQSNSISVESFRDLVIFEEDGKTERLRYNFPRQDHGEFLCLSDYFSDLSLSARDVVAFMGVTMGEGRRRSTWATG